jgi:hypothetical protein
MTDDAEYWRRQAKEIRAIAERMKDWVRPTAQIYCASAQPWVQLGGAMKSFERTPS